MCVFYIFVTKIKVKKKLKKILKKKGEILFHVCAKGGGKVKKFNIKIEESIKFELHELNDKNEDIGKFQSCNHFASENLQTMRSELWKELRKNNENNRSLHYIDVEIYKDKNDNKNLSFAETNK